MEYMPGTQINDRVNLNRRGIDVNKTIEAVTEMYSQMIFKHGFIHCDPHPGNILINKQKNGDPEIVLLDHGLYQTINDEFRYHYALLWKSLVKGDISNIRLAARYLNVEDMFPLLSGKLNRFHQTTFFLTVEISNYAGVLEMAVKVIKEGLVT